MSLAAYYCFATDVPNDRAYFATQDGLTFYWPIRFNGHVIKPYEWWTFSLKGGVPNNLIGPSSERERKAASAYGNVLDDVRARLVKKFPKAKAKAGDFYLALRPAVMTLYVSPV